MEYSHIVTFYFQYIDEITFRLPYYILIDTIIVFELYNEFIFYFRPLLNTKSAKKKKM
jgi:hypothetical protein